MVTALGAGEILKITIEDINTNGTTVIINKDRSMSYKEYIKVKTGCSEYKIISISSTISKPGLYGTTIHYIWVDCLKKREYRDGRWVD